MTLLNDIDVRVVCLVNGEVLEQEQGLVGLLGNAPGAQVVVQGSADEDAAFAEEGEGGHDVPVGRDDGLEEGVAELLASLDTHGDDAVVAAAHEHHVVGCLQGEDILFLFDEFNWTKDKEMD